MLEFMARAAQRNPVAHVPSNVWALRERLDVVRVHVALRTEATLLARVVVSFLDLSRPPSAHRSAPGVREAVFPLVVRWASQGRMLRKYLGQLAPRFRADHLTAVGLRNVRAVLGCLRAATLIVSVDVFQRLACDVAKCLAVPLWNPRLGSTAALAIHTLFYREAR